MNYFEKKKAQTGETLLFYHAFKILPKPITRPMTHQHITNRGVFKQHKTSSENEEAIYLSSEITKQTYRFKA